MPYQGPWSKCNHCNNNMLATHKHNASALFWYTQRYHESRSTEHRQGLLWQFAMAEIVGHGPGAPDHGPRVSDHGPLVLAF
jgi:hypothetical protein